MRLPRALAFLLLPLPSRGDTLRRLGIGAVLAVGFPVLGSSAEAGGPDRRDRASASAGPHVTISPPHSGKMALTSSAVGEGGALPAEFNGDGAGATLPLAWSGAPEGTRSFALVMDHLDRDGVMKVYWVLHGIPPTVSELPKNVQGIGQFGATWKRGQRYVPPHSAGGGKQTYTLHLYALASVPEFDAGPSPVTRDALLTHIKDSILDSADLRVTYQRAPDAAPGAGQARKGGRKEKSR